MTLNELISMIIGYGLICIVVIMLSLLYRVISGWLELRALRKLSRESNLRARPRWFSSGVGDL